MFPNQKAHDARAVLIRVLQIPSVRLSKPPPRFPHFSSHRYRQPWHDMDRDSRKDEHGYYSLSHGDDDDTASFTTPKEKVEQNNQSEVSYLNGMDALSDQTPQYTSPSESNADRFEKPHYTSLIIYTICCAAIYPFFYLICWAARGQSLTVVRAVIAIASSIASFALTLSLNEFARKFTEAAGMCLIPTLNHIVIF